MIEQSFRWSLWNN